MRLFVAIEVPKNICEKINDFVFRNYRLLGNNKFTWVKKDNLHLTLKFLGETKNDLVEKIIEILNSVSSNSKKFKAQIKGVGIFPNISFIKVLWLGIQDNNNKLSLLAEDIDEKMFQLGFKKETRSFVSHLTIARIKSVKNIEKIKCFIQKFCELSFGVFEVDSITLYESILKPQGPEYKIIKKFYFSN